MTVFICPSIFSPTGISPRNPLPLLAPKAPFHLTPKHQVPPHLSYNYCLFIVSLNKTSSFRTRPDLIFLLWTVASRRVHQGVVLGTNGLRYSLWCPHLHIPYQIGMFKSWHCYFWSIFLLIHVPRCRWWLKYSRAQPHFQALGFDLGPTWVNLFKLQLPYLTIA